VANGELLPRSEADGGVGVKLALPLAPSVDGGAGDTPVILEAFPGCAGTLEDLFDVAHDFATVRCGSACVKSGCAAWF
jgi:hypothetical protein